jgi:hypothetical protein
VPSVVVQPGNSAPLSSEVSSSAVTASGKKIWIQALLLLSKNSKKSNMSRKA